MCKSLPQSGNLLLIGATGIAAFSLKWTWALSSILKCLREIKDFKNGLIAQGVGGGGGSGGFAVTGSLGGTDGDCGDGNTVNVCTELDPIHASISTIGDRASLTLTWQLGFSPIAEYSHTAIANTVNTPSTETWKQIMLTANIKTRFTTGSESTEG
jgi:hypothetical protein